MFCRKIMFRKIQKKGSEKWCSLPKNEELYSIILEKNFSTNFWGVFLWEIFHQKNIFRKKLFFSIFQKTPQSGLRIIYFWNTVKFFIFRQRTSFFRRLFLKFSKHYFSAEHQFSALKNLFSHIIFQQTPIFSRHQFSVYPPDIFFHKKNEIWMIYPFCKEG